MSFVQNMCIAMLVTVRDTLLEGDFSVAMKLLQCYPRDIDTYTLIVKAVSIYEEVGTALAIVEFVNCVGLRCSPLTPAGGASAAPRGVYQDIIIISSYV
jgi:hypothetical protein